MFTMTKTESSTFNDEEEPLTSATSSTLAPWFEEGAARTRNNQRGPIYRRLHTVFTSPHFYYLIAIFLILGLYVNQIINQRPFRSYLPPVPSPHIKPVCVRRPRKRSRLAVPMTSIPSTLSFIRG